LNAIRGILAEVGFAGAELARELDDGTLELIDGHARAEVAGSSDIPVLILDVNESEANKILATFDPIGAMAESDSAILDSVLREVETANEDLSVMLADLAKDAGLYLDDGSSEVFEDEVPEPPSDPITKIGDVWMLGRHRLLCGDSTNQSDFNFLMNNQKSDLCFTSPPYNASANTPDGDVFNGKKSKKMYDGKYSDDLPSEEYVSFAQKVLGLCFKNTSGFIFWNVGYNANAKSEYIKQIVPFLDHLIEQVCWKKNSAIPVKGCMRRAWEPIFIFSSTKKSLELKTVESNIWEISNKNCQLENHKACFPVLLPSKAFEILPKSKTVLDPFLGSGTTLIAAEQLGRTCYGMELSPQYCDVIVERWQNLTGEKAKREN
jgi:DNA modification methylase